MKLSRLFFLLFRYITLAFVGMSIAVLWRICHLDYYEHWGKFYALWIPLLYGFISTGYVVVAGCFTHSATERDTRNKLHSAFDHFRNYDDYTYLLLLWIFVLEIAGAYLKNVYLWLSISYLALLVVKGSIFFRYLYKIICDGQLDATSKVVPNDDEQLDATSKVVPNDNEPLDATSKVVPNGGVPVWIRCILVFTALIVYILISAYHIQRTSLTGDEPHYLLITHSLWHDHDTNLYNNYKNKNYTSFFWYELRPAELDKVSATEIYSYRHKGGFPYTLIPGYVLGGQLGSVLLMNLFAALLMLQVFLLSYELFHSLTASFLTWSCISFTIPVVIYMNQIYPEILAALLVLWGVRRIRMLLSGNSLRSRHFWINCLYIGITLIFLVFLKTRYVPLAGALVLFLTYHLLYRLLQGKLHIKHKFRMIAGVGLILILGVIVVLFVNKYVFDNTLFDRINDRRWMRWMLGGYNPLSGFLGLFFDQEYGVFPYTPFYIIALVGIGMLTRKELKTAWPILGIIFLNYSAICLWPLWHAGPSPPSRYILPVLPLLGVFLARFFVQKRGRVNVIVPGMCAIWSFLSAWIVTLSPRWRYNWADGTNNFLEMLSLRLSVNLTKIFPSWIRVSSLTPHVTVFGIMCIGLLIYYCRINAKKPLEESRRRSSGFQVIPIVSLFVLVSIIGLAIGKKLPTLVLEAEDTLDVRTHGGERVPATLDPWDNQIYLREQRFYGWKLFPGNSLKARPKLSPGEFEIEIYARAKFEEQGSANYPVMLVFMKEKEVGRITVSSDGWKVYKFSLFADERRPQIEIRHESVIGSENVLIIDKIRFR